MTQENTGLSKSSRILLYINQMNFTSNLSGGHALHEDVFGFHWYLPNSQEVTVVGDKSPIYAEFINYVCVYTHNF